MAIFATSFFCILTGWLKIVDDLEPSSDKVGNLKRGFLRALRIFSKIWKVGVNRFEWNLVELFLEMIDENPHNQFLFRQISFLVRGVKENLSHGPRKCYFSEKNYWTFCDTTAARSLVFTYVELSNCKGAAASPLRPSQYKLEKEKGV